MNVTYKLKYEEKEYCIVAIDIDHFKLYNRWWGKKAGEIFLSELKKVLKNY